jgi:malic enzyme
MFLAAARTLAAAVSPDRLAAGALYPPVTALRAVSRSIARVVAAEAVAADLAGVPSGSDLAAAIDAAMWWPDYVPYSPARQVERRRSTET